MKTLTGADEPEPQPVVLPIATGGIVGRMPYVVERDGGGCFMPLPVESATRSTVDVRLFIDAREVRDQLMTRAGGHG